MEIRFYTRDLDLIGIMENQTSILWRRKFYEPGTFEIYAPITEYNTKLCRLENIVQIEGANEAGVIEEVLYQQENTYNKVRISGRFMSSYFDRRLIIGRMRFSGGKVENAMRKIVTEMEPLSPYLVMGGLKSFPEKVAFQATYKNVLTTLTKLSRSSNIGYRLIPDFTNKRITFDLYKGTDHSMSQNARTRVVFNEEYQNVNSAKWQVNEQLLKNICYVGAEYDEKAAFKYRYFHRTGDNSLSYLDRREMYVNGSDITNYTSIDEMMNLLEQRGKDRLAVNTLATSLECTATPIGNFVYRRDYDLGDIVTVQKESWGVSEDKKITELLEVYENGTMIVTPTLGAPLPETVDWSDQDGA